MKQFKEFIKKINKGIKSDLGYKEGEILNDIQIELRSVKNKNSYYQQLKRFEDLIANFIKSGVVKIDKAVTKREKYLYRSVFRKLAKKYEDEKYYQALISLPRRPIRKLLPKQKIL